MYLRGGWGRRGAVCPPAPYPPPISAKRKGSRRAIRPTHPMCIYNSIVGPAPIDPPPLPLGNFLPPPPTKGQIRHWYEESMMIKVWEVIRFFFFVFPKRVTFWSFICTYCVNPCNFLKGGFQAIIFQVDFNNKLIIKKLNKLNKQNSVSFSKIGWKIGKLWNFGVSWNSMKHLCKSHEATCKWAKRWCHRLTIQHIYSIY